MGITWQDVRYAIRGLLRNPGFAITAILSLMLGIGASLAIFTVADTVLLRPMPFRDPDRLVMVWEKNSRRPKVDENSISPGNFLDWQKQNDVFESMSPFGSFRAVLSDNGRAEELQMQAVGRDFFPMLGVQPVRGRLFTDAEYRASISAQTVVLISYRVWQGWFGGDQNIVGRRIQLNSTPRTIVGVLTPGFTLYHRDVDLWQPLGLDPARDYRATSGRYLLSLARLKPGVSRAEAQSHMDIITRRLEAAYPKFDTNWSVNVEPLREAMVRQVKASLLILLGAAGLLLAVACSNVANLLLARCAGRRVEMAVRTSLGAGRWRVMRQLLTESVLLGLVGGIAGVALARGGIVALLALAPRALVR